MKHTEIHRELLNHLDLQNILPEKAREQQKSRDKKKRRIIKTFRKRNRSMSMPDTFVQWLTVKSFRQKNHKYHTLFAGSPKLIKENSLDEMILALLNYVQLCKSAQKGKSKILDEVRYKFIFLIALVRIASSQNLQTD